MQKTVKQHVEQHAFTSTAGCVMIENANPVAHMKLDSVALVAHSVAMPAAQRLVVVTQGIYEQMISIFDRNATERALYAME